MNPSNPGQAAANAALARLNHQLPTPSPTQFAQGPVIHDPDHYTNLNVTVIKVKEIHFRIDPSLLVDHSPVFKDMLSLPLPQREDPTTVEGLSNINPIELAVEPAIEASDFAALLQILSPNSRAARENPLTTEGYKGLLCIGHFLDVELAMEAAIAHLSQWSTLPPAERLYLALRYEVHQWIRPAILSLLHTSLDKLPRNHVVEWLLAHNANAYFALVEGSTAISNHRRDLYAAPYTPKHAPGCRNGTMCAAMWADLWSKYGTLLIASVWTNGHEILEKLEEAGRRKAQDSNGGVALSLGCLMANVDHIRNGEYLWKRELELTELTIKDILGPDYVGRLPAAE